MSDEPGNFEIVTPFSAYTGKNLQLMLEPDKRFILNKDHYRSLQTHVQKIQHGIIEDISRLSMTRSKWKTLTNPVKNNQMVLVKDNRIGPIHWKLARVNRLLSDPDGTTRVVEVIRPVYANENYPKGPNSSTRKRLETRHVIQLAPLPVDSGETEEVYTSSLPQIAENNEVQDQREEDSNFDENEAVIEVNEPMRADSTQRTKY